MSAKFPPGPLTVKEAAAPCAHNGDVAIVNDKGSLIAVAYARPDGSQRDMGRLIVAAPDLLEACMVAFDQTCSVGRPRDWEQLRAAIAKATGTTQS